jgi:arylsulfatase A-like enzyme
LFNSIAIYSSTRTALITKRNNHLMGFGVISEQSTGFRVYDSIMTKDKASVAKTLKESRYWTSWFGKDHNFSLSIAQFNRSRKDEPRQTDFPPDSPDS